MPPRQQYRSSLKALSELLAQRREELAPRKKRLGAPFRLVFAPFSAAFGAVRVRFSFRRRAAAPAKAGESKATAPASDAAAAFKGERLCGLREQLVVRRPGELEALGVAFCMAFTMF